MWWLKRSSRSGLSWRDEYYVLAKYNGEVARGIVHTKEWKERMKELQEQYDTEYLGGGDHDRRYCKIND